MENVILPNYKHVKLPPILHCFIYRLVDFLSKAHFILQKHVLTEKAITLNNTSNKH